MKRFGNQDEFKQRETCQCMEMTHMIGPFGLSGHSDDCIKDSVQKLMLK